MQPTSFSWYAPITAVALPLAAAWILFIGLSAASYRLANSRFAVTANDERWVDVSDEASNYAAGPGGSGRVGSSS